MDQTDAFRVLASADRQLVLHELVDDSDPIAVGSLATRVAARRHKISSGAVSDEQADRAQVRLVHLHFPQLESRDIIAIDWETREVQLGDSTDVTAVLEAAEELEQWPPDDMLASLS